MSRWVGGSATRAEFGSLHGVESFASLTAGYGTGPLPRTGTRQCTLGVVGPGERAGAASKPRMRLASPQRPPH
jgi:hypothetical protein